MPFGSRRRDDEIRTPVDVPDVAELPSDEPSVETEAASAPPPAPRVELDALLLRRLVQLEDGLKELRGAVDQVAATTARVEADHSLNDRMYADLQELRAHEGGARSLPVVTDIIHIVDRIEEHGRRSDPMLQSVAEELLQAMGRVGVERIERGSGDGFDPAVQKQVGLLPADADVDLEIVLAGYRDVPSGRVVRHQHVRVRRRDP